MDRTHCTWCGKKIDRSRHCWALKGRSRVDLSEHAGDSFLAEVLSVGRSVQFVVPAAESQARRDGVDFVVALLCSETCAKQTRAALEADMRWYDLTVG